MGSTPPWMNASTLAPSNKASSCWARRVRFPVPGPRSDVAELGSEPSLVRAHERVHRPLGMRVLPLTPPRRRGDLRSQNSATRLLCAVFPTTHRERYPGGSRLVQLQILSTGTRSKVARMGLAGIRYPLICQPAYRREWAITVSQHQALSRSTLTSSIHVLSCVSLAGRGNERH